MIYTAEQVKEITTVKYWPIRSCSICGVTVGYHIHPERERVAFDSSCGCNSIGGWEERSWQEIANLINMQKSEATQKQMIKELSGGGINN